MRKTAETGLCQALGVIAIFCGCGSDGNAPVEAGDPSFAGGDVPTGASGAAGTMASIGAGGAPGTAGDPSAGVAPGAPVAPVQPTSDVLDALPDVVYLKTTTHSYNRMYYLAVLDGGLWVKPNVEQSGIDGPWTRAALPPGLEGRLAQVSADDHGVVLLDDAGQLYWTMSGALSVPFSPAWITSWGAPLATGPGFNLPDGVLKWEYAVLTLQEDNFWIDTAGNPQNVGLGSVAHIWILNEDKQRITYVDPILPVDLSYEMCGPLRGRFQAENLSASGSTTFVINRYGDMYTRLYDFDISGADTLFFRYSYEDQSAAAFPAFQLPAPSWVQQPKISGEITDRITIFKTGIGSDSRMLRVEGTDADGNVGFYEKPIAATSSADWVFRRTDETLRGNALDNTLDDRSGDAVGPVEDRAYAGSAGAGMASIDDFNLYCTPSTFTVRVASGASVDLILHTVDSIRQVPRARGLDADPYILQGTIEVPQALLDGLSSLDPEIQSFIGGSLGGRRFTATPISATLDRLSFDAFGWTFDHTPPD